MSFTSTKDYIISWSHINFVSIISMAAKSLTKWILTSNHMNTVYMGHLPLTVFNF